MEDSQTAAAVLEEEKTQTEPETEPAPEREVIDGKRMVWRKLPMEKVQRVLSFSPKPLKIPQGPVFNPMILDSIKGCMDGLELLRQSQEAMREDLRTKGYVMGWVTDDDE